MANGLWNKLRFKNLSIKYKLIFMLYIAILPFLLFLSGYLYYTMQKGTTDSLSSAYQEIARQINESISFIQTDVTDISTYVAINENVKKVLSEAGTAEEMSQTWTKDSSMNFFMDIIGTKSYISYIALYTNNGYEPYYITTDTSVLKNDINDIMKTNFYNRADEAKGAAVWQRVDKNDKSIFEINKSSKIMMSRVIIDHMEVKNIGYLILGINAGYLEKICKGSMTTKDEGMIVRMNGETLIETGNLNKEIEGYILSDTLKNTIKGKAKLKSVIYKDYMICFSQINENSSEVYYIIPRSTMIDKLGTVKLVPILIIVGVLSLMLPISFIMSGSIARPLKRLTVSMKKFQLGDFSQQVKVNSTDEIGEVSLCYNDMVQTMKELIDTSYISKIREREAELSALQAQINPHFLYNTLDSIYWKALTDGNDGIAEMVYSLSRIFRLSLNRGQGMTTVEKEVELVTHYLMIQKMRFNEKLEYSIEVDNNLNNYIVPKLILQPFVENSIIHGIEKNGSCGTVAVIIERIGDKLNFIILDSGKGMKEEQVESLLSKADGDVNTKKTPGGYAISNVYERLKLKFKDDFKLSIQSKRNKGTRVVIEIPITEVLSEEV
ncbi:two-component system sensor histidine kinase YesM [Mobilisporobacter senegalensis]|uniref:Two-component system sensor histidine kinase YesM n=1 Tax=Mobilisporobacter senegalensis TaxID=1329262 RepID=A0A3N1XL69_9FIRM|nr:sensor histidine kinase [Mobilisporobacter senegalensis]ROR27426.1 two-component system sensor histidine kinase YesM [Mobilisporobacter senegalensis]